MFVQVVGILFPVFSLAFVGFLIGRWLKPDFKPINRINLDVLVPALVFSSLVVMPMEMRQLPLLSASVVAVILPGIIMIPICKVFKLNFKVWAPPNMFRNSGNLAIPLLTYTFGDTALAPAVLLFVISSCAHISIGLGLLSNGNPIKQVVTTPIFLAALSGLILNLSGVGIWEPLYQATYLLGGAAIPIMLLSLGSQMCNIRIEGLKIGIMSTILSLFTGAIAFIIIYLLIPLPTLHLQMILLFTMLPPAVMNYIFAERFHVAPEKVASMILFSNFFSIITLPIMLVVALSLG